MRYTYPRITMSSASTTPGVVLGITRPAAYELQKNGLLGGQSKMAATWREFETSISSIIAHGD